MELQKYEQEYLDILRPLLPECTVLLKRMVIFHWKNRGKSPCMVMECARR